MCKIFEGIIKFPQGSVLASILFIIYTADRARVVKRYNVTFKAFADDMKLYSIINNADSIGNIQLAIDDVLDWSSQWQLPISNTKCYLMDVGPPRKIGEFQPNSLAGVDLGLVDTARDLGIYIDSNMSFSSHIMEIVARAKRSLPTL